MNSYNSKSRYWSITIHKRNLEKAGFTEEDIQNYPFILNRLLKIWEDSGKGRTGCFTACISADGLFHIHGAIYGEKTSCFAVSKLFFDSHTEPCVGGLKTLNKYIKKEPPYDEKGEQVLCIIGKENIKTSQGKRSDITVIEELLADGYTPDEIMNIDIRFRNNEKIIRGAYLSKKIKETPKRKEMYREWHIGETGTGKSYYYERLCEKYGIDEIYLTGYVGNGWLDGYIDQGAPQTLYIDDLRPNGNNLQEILSVLDVYSHRVIHARYQNIRPLWTNVVITSTYPPELYLLYEAKQKQPMQVELRELLRKLDIIVYHYAEDGVYKEFSIPSSEYKDYDDLKRRAKEEGGEIVVSIETKSQV